MLVYDAGTKSQEGYYAGDRSRLSDLAGVNYALYNSLRDGMIQSANVRRHNSHDESPGSAAGEILPPFRPIREKWRRRATSTSRLSFGATSTAIWNIRALSLRVSYAGHVLLRSRAGIVAGYHPYQKGSVLFVNLPLGYLDGYTDGLPLHAFLKYFATQVLSLPYLMSVPDGVGGLVLNWHVDSNAAIKALEKMETWNILKQGPYSIDITAGPDTYALW